jgi:hypothetical protein
MPRPLIASREYVRDVQTALGLERAEAEKVADFVGAEIERVGGSDARLVFTVDDGTGPYCSWCWALAGLCKHIAGGLSEHIATTTEETTHA